MRVFRKILIAACILFGILLAAAVILGRIFEDELTRYTVDGLNRHIRTEVEIKDVKLSFLRKFPDATLEFRDVFMASVPGFNSAVFEGQDTDTLLMADHLYLRFNIIKLLKRQFTVREVKVQSGKLSMYIDREGNNNYQFWERKSGPGEKKFLLGAH